MLSINNAKYYIAIFVAVFIWSSAIIVTKFALTDLGPVTLSAVRILIAAVALLPFALKRGFHFKDYFTQNAFLYGIFGYGGNLVLLSIGLTVCTANISSVIHGLFPVFMILFGHGMMGENITGNKVLGIIFSVAGVVIASAGDLSQNSGTTLLGILLNAGAVLTWAFYSVLAKKNAAGMDSFVLSEICLGTSFICVLPLAVLEILFTGFSAPSPGAAFSLIYLGVMSGSAATLLWNFGLKKINSAVAGVYFNLMPVIGLFLALFLHERIALLQVFGCVLILAGVVICTRTDIKKEMKEGLTNETGK
ncbi:MAG TPA: DMT family transporter [Anaerovoracaceae bacterium]|nr:DMT family transporter [Anaerovoracaceae bacterium]